VLEFCFFLARGLVGALVGRSRAQVRAAISKRNRRHGPGRGRPLHRAAWRSGACIRIYARLLWPISLVSCPRCRALAWKELAGVRGLVRGGLLSEISSTTTSGAALDGDEDTGEREAFAAAVLTWTDAQLGLRVVGPAGLIQIVPPPKPRR